MAATLIGPDVVTIRTDAAGTLRKEKLADVLEDQLEVVAFAEKISFLKIVG